MNARDLRIGNLVFECSIIHEVDGHDISVNESLGKNFLFDPIPLTEEWLLKFGFKKDGGHWDFPNGSSFELHETQIENVFNLGFDYQVIRFIEIKYVHKLQNINYELEEIELEIKEPIK